MESLEGLDDSPVANYGGMLDLHGRGYLVVGAGRGMGRQTAHAISAHGGRVLCADIDPARAEAVAKEVGGVAHVGDVRQPADVEAMVQRAAGELGSLDGVVDIVGMARYAALVDTADEDWDWVQEM